MWAYLWDQVRVLYARLERAYIEFTNELDTLMASNVSKFISHAGLKWFSIPSNILFGHVAGVVGAIQ